VTPTPGLDLDKLRQYLDAEHPGFADGELSAEVIAGGKSNLTYVVRAADQSWVLRRPPLGHVLATAHDMAREYRVMTALGPTTVPVPGTHFLCGDVDVIGAPFYVMQHVDGTVYRTSRETADLTPQRAVDMSDALIDVLADLHDIDPAAIGLGDFGRPEGFLERQLRRWHKQLDGSRSREIEGMDELFQQLSDTLPESGAPAIVHGDYRLDNVIVGADDRVAAVLDWEMATVGDPLTDLGLLIVYWDGMVHVPARALTTAVNPSVGFPRGRELIDRYAHRRSIDLSRLNWYVAFGYIKLAVISEGIYFRYQAGQTVGAGFELMGDIVKPLVELGHAALTATEL
jgi:aminoglycoside phosphotransferase (APT) family kinase protein